MTAVSIALPALLAIGIASIATSAHHRLPPRLAARFVSIALVLVTAAAVPTGLVLAMAYLAHVPVIGLGFEWCARVMGLHQTVPGWLGIPMVALVGAGAVKTTRLLRDHRRLCLHEAQPVHVVPSERPFAVTMPGRAGQIVISTAMVDLLDDDERRIVVAHEAAHARYRHDRYLLIAALASAALPPLQTLAKRITYSIERWADEAAADLCGDRHRVATTLGKVALHVAPPVTHPGIAGIGGLGVASRMDALLAPPVPAPRRHQLVALWASLGVTAGFGLYQLHHIERLLTALCPH